MSDTGYCRFENILEDLQDCWENWDEELSDREMRAKKKVIELAMKITDVESTFSVDEYICSKESCRKKFRMNTHLDIVKPVLCHRCSMEDVRRRRKEGSRER